MLRHISIAIAILAAPLAAQAQDVDSRAQDILAAMQGTAGYETVFDPVFTAQIPEAAFDELTQQLEGQFGRLLAVEDVQAINPTTATAKLRFERAVADGVFQLATEPPHRVVGFRVTGATPTHDTAEALVADVAALPGTASVLITRLGNAAPMLEYNADRPLGIGSTFKLYVLSALAHEVAAGHRSWADVVPLTTRSYPSGVTQAWPQGAQVTLHTLASLMISISDNTATDQLIAVLGRDAVEAEVAASGHADPQLLRPFMTTRELFVLKSAVGPDGTEVPRDYRAADADGRLRILEGLAEASPSDEEVMAAFAGGPNAIDVEWLASGEDLANVMRRLAALDDPTARQIMAINPAVTPTLAQDFSYVGYKGGSEPGVLGMSWLLQDRAGQWSVVSLGWNDPAAEVDLASFNALAMRAISLARGD